MVAEVEQTVLASGSDSCLVWHHCIVELPGRHNSGLESMLAEPVVAESRVCIETEHRSSPNHPDAACQSCLSYPCPSWKQSWNVTSRYLPRFLYHCEHPESIAPRDVSFGLTWCSLARFIFFAKNSFTCSKINCFSLLSGKSSSILASGI